MAKCKCKKCGHEWTENVKYPEWLKSGRCPKCSNNNTEILEK